MSRTNRRDRRDRDERVMRAPPGLKRLGQVDQNVRRGKVLDWLRGQPTDIVTVGSVKGFRFTFRFAEVWAWMFPGTTCPSRR